jgi:hypothetical protein
MSYLQEIQSQRICKSPRVVTDLLRALLDGNPVVLAHTPRECCGGVFFMSRMDHCIQRMRGDVTQR